MANLPISGLTASASNLASTDLAPVVQTVGVGPVKMTGLQLAAGLLSATMPIGSGPILSRAGAAALQLGAADTTGTTAPTPQFLCVQSWSSSTNNNQTGADFTIQGSRGTGTGAGGSIIFQVAPAGSSGTAQNAYSTALTINSAQQALFAAGTKALPSVTFSGNTAGLYSRVSGYITLTDGTREFCQLSAVGSLFSGNIGLKNGAADYSAQSADVFMYCDGAANTLALRNGTSAQTYRIYATADGSPGSNFQRLTLSAGVTANMAVVAADNGGTGLAMGLQFGIAKTTGGGVTPVGMFTTVSGNTLFALGDSVAATSSFPALKRSSATLQVRLADDTAFAPLSCGNTTASGTALDVSGTGAASIFNVVNTTTGTLLSVVNSSSSTIFSVNDAAATGVQVAGVSFGLTGNISAAAWTTSGIRYRNVAATLTDTSSSGTVATAYTDVFGGNTIAASSSTTYTNYATFRLAGPTAGTNVTFTNSWALSLGGSLVMDDATNIAVGTTTGTKIGTSTSQKIGFYNKTPVVQPTAMTTALTSITSTAPGTPDYAIQDLVDSASASAFGFATKDEGNTVLSVIANLQTRVNELETKLQALGLLA